MTGSRAASASRSSAGRYITSSSLSECEYGRITFACTSAGPFRSRAYATAFAIASKLAAKSQPSTFWMYNPGNPVSSFEMLPPAVFTSTGTLIA